MIPQLRGVALVLAVLTAGCGDDTPTAPTPTTPGTIAAALLSCPPSVERQSIDALPVTVSWDLPTVAGIPVDKGSCSPGSGSVFPIGVSTVVCTPDQPTLASSCSFSITITPPDPTLRVTSFMAFGDSITAGEVGNSFLPPGVTARELLARLRAARGRPIPGSFTVVQPLNSYPAQLHNLLTRAYTTQLISVANEGLSGERASQGVSRLTASLLAGQPQVLMLFEGFNDIDLAFLGGPAGDDTPNNVASIAADLRSMALNAHGRGVDLLLATLTPVTDAREESDPGTRATIIALNAEIRGIAAALGLGGVVDLYAALDGVPGTIGADGFHPTVAGYRRMADVFFAEIVSRYDITPQAPSLTGP